MLQLTISPGGNHGADSTLVDWTIQQVGASNSKTPRRWSVADLVGNLTEANPASAGDEASWCLLDVSDGPAFLSDKKEAIDGHAELKAWSLGDLPSAFVNAADHPVSVWTTLPARSFFVHPGPERPVAVAWICPCDGEFEIHGRVADAHPAGLDGVSFTLAHLASAEFGQALAEAGRLAGLPLPDPGPEPVIPGGLRRRRGEPARCPSATTG